MSTYNFTIQKGATFQTTITYKDSDGAKVDLSGYEAAMQIKSEYGGTAIVTLSSSLGTTYPSGADLSGSKFISLSGSYDFTTPLASGSIGIYLGYDVTDGLAAGDYLYDLELLNTTTYEKIRLLRGKVKVDNEVTTVEPA